MKRAKILSASAGSGKTFQLALKYICDIIERPDSYRSILAVTFTNKATEEMKSRILREIHVLASGGKSPYMEHIQTTMGLSEECIKECALVARNKILHDFSRFNVLTIDKFFQRILRAFIKELGLDLNYEIELDTDMILERGVENLVDSISEDKEVRRWLFDFAEERLSKGEKWDIRRDLSNLGNQLFGESGAKRMRRNISKEELREIVKLIVEDAERYLQRIKDLGERGLAIMAEYGVTSDMFKYKDSGCAAYFGTYAEGGLKAPTDRMLKGIEDVSAWYGKNAPGNVICAAEKLRPILEEICGAIDKCIEKQNTARLVRKQYRSFALLVDLQKYINGICDDENIMILSETKDILAEFVDDNNAPFIYEKIGNRYDHYMIDEFQDTSVREWRNMLPLLKEALASNNRSSVFIVGDIKQSIYRWRGGDWRLLNQQALDDLGHNDTAVEHLQKNYRSLANVVEFNNLMIRRMVECDTTYLNSQLDAALQSHKISKATHGIYHDILLRAYQDHHQIPAIKSQEKGYVELCAYDSKVTDSPFIEAIESAIARGYKYRDILILVRKGDDAAKVANILFEYKERRFTSQNLPGFNILMADALTLDGCDVVEFIKAVLRLSINSNNDIDRGLYNRFNGRAIGDSLTDEDIEHLSRIAHLSPMEAFEDIVSYYKLSEHRDSIAYLQAMHEQIVVFSAQRTADISQFLVWWEERGKKVNIAVEMSDDTIEIMTIHKAKGLERDVVIIPYARWAINPNPALNPIVWAEADSSSEAAATIGAFPVAFGSTMKESAFAEHYYHEAVMNHVDNLNMIYVALTRASKELYVYVPNDKPSDNISNSGQLLLNAITSVCPNPESVMVEDKERSLHYKYGEPLRNGACDKRRDSVQEVLLNNYISNQPSIKVRYPAQRHIDEELSYANESMGMGVRLHSIFERAKTYDDLHKAIETLVVGCYIDKADAEILQQKVDAMLANPTVSEWFNGAWSDVKCEASIISKTGIRRPDRVMVKEDRVVVVDYKFGEKRSSGYSKQMKEYITLLRDMRCYENIEGYVWYVTLGDVEKVI